MALRFPNRRFGSGSFAFPAPSSTFAVTGRVPEGFPDRRPPRPKPELTTYVTLASPSKHSLERWSRLSAGPPLVRFARPSADTNRVRQLPGASSHRHGAATRRTCSARVVSHHLDGLLRTRPRGLVASRSRPGVRRVSGDSRSRSRLARPKSDRHGGGPPSPFPATQGSHPSKSVLVDSRNRVSAVRCLLAVTGARPTATAAEAATREVGPGEPGAAGPPPAGAGATRWHGPSSRYGEAPIRRERRTPTSPGRAGIGEPMRGTRGPTRRQRRSADERAVESRAKRHARTAHRRWETREHPRVPRAPSDGRDRQTTALHARHAEASRADSSRRRERPTSGPCSVDESVVLRRRCRRTNTRSFHGLCSPPRSTRAPLHARSMPGPGRRCGPRPERPRCGPGVETGAAPLGSL